MVCERQRQHARVRAAGDGERGAEAAGGQDIVVQHDDLAAAGEGDGGPAVSGMDGRRAGTGDRAHRPFGECVLPS